MNLSKILILTATTIAAITLSHRTAMAVEIVVTPGDPTWSNPAGENGNGTGSSAITGTSPRSGNGSVELFGDRTRFIGVLGDNGLLKQVTGFTFDWSIATDSVSALSPDYTPALRLLIMDGATASELIWEGAYNGTYGNTTKGVWYSSGANDKFYKNGTSENAGVPIYDALTAYSYSPDAYIAGISIGVGSSAGAGYHAFADNVTLSLYSPPSLVPTPNIVTTYNFEVASVPDAGSSLALLGTALAGVALFRRKLLA